MKCPKCAYFGLDDGDRCRNCGYEFALVADADVPPPAAGGRPRATPLSPAPPPRQTPGRPRASGPAREFASPVETALSRPLDRGADAGALDLPLFDAEFAPGAPLPPPQRPLSVRRAGTLTPRARVSRDTPLAGSLPLEPDPNPALPVGASVPRSRTVAPAPSGCPAAPSRRAGAWVVDASLMLLVDLITLYFTLRLCGLSPAEWDVLPGWPLAVFFVVLNGGYVVLLTGTLGQTVGKMALQIEVVADGRASVGLGIAALRLAAAMLSLVAVGLGFVWAFVGDRRTWHDRIAGTRVVQVTLS
jgi:uncharacterized RDD family membrane protein YckC